jgi:hypothetical protein
VVERFASDGLNTRDYLKAALKQPSLFYQSPATIAANIAGVVERFASDGLTMRDYLNVAVQQPTLFYQAPRTVIGHVNMIIELHRQGLVTFPDEANNTHQRLALRPLFDFLLKNPIFFCLSDDNFTLREISARVTGEPPSGTGLLRRKRHQVESALAETLGHSDSKAPVRQVARPSDGRISDHMRATCCCVPSSVRASSREPWNVSRQAGRVRQTPFLDLRECHPALAAFIAASRMWSIFPAMCE